MTQTTETRIRPSRGKRLKAAAAALALVGLALLGWVLAQEWAGRARGFQDRLYQNASGQDVRYVVFVPHNYSWWKRYPLILFLHGWGERGSDGRRQTSVGLAPAIRRRGEQFDFLAVFPQVLEGKWQADSEDARLAMGILADVEKRYQVDPKRVYLTGLSSGGGGVWNLAAKYPDRWAAIVPVAGAGDPKLAPRIKHIPCWCFHASNDVSIPAEGERRMIRALRAAGGKPRYEEAIGVNNDSHNIWDRAYGKPELYEWLLQQRLP